MEDRFPLITVQTPVSHVKSTGPLICIGLCHFTFLAGPSPQISSRYRGTRQTIMGRATTVMCHYVGCVSMRAPRP